MKNPKYEYAIQFFIRYYDDYAQEWKKIDPKEGDQKNEAGDKLFYGYDPLSFDKMSEKQKQTDDVITYNFPYDSAFKNNMVQSTTIMVIPEMNANQTKVGRPCLKVDAYYYL